MKPKSKILSAVIVVVFATVAACKFSAPENPDTTKDSVNTVDSTVINSDSVNSQPLDSVQTN